MSDRETFGPRLRSERERRGISLETLASVTKVGAELWDGLERNDFSRWPTGIFARAFVRDYARAVGLDADEVVNEFCRLFPEWGDRRAERVMREKAEIIAHDLTWEDLPAPQKRRASDRSGPTAAGFFTRYEVRIFAMLMDTAAMLGLATVGRLLGLAFWPALALASMSYTLLATSTTGRSFGLITSEWLIRTLKSMPAARRLTSSRAHSA